MLSGLKSRQEVQLIFVTPLSPSPPPLYHFAGMPILHSAQVSTSFRDSLVASTPTKGALHMTTLRMTTSRILARRRLGKSGPEVPALGFGSMGLSAFYGKPQPDEERFKILDRAYELGETCKQPFHLPS